MSSLLFLDILDIEMMFLEVIADNYLSLVKLLLIDKVYLGFFLSYCILHIFSICYNGIQKYHSFSLLFGCRILQLPFREEVQTGSELFDVSGMHFVTLHHLTGGGVCFFLHHVTGVNNFQPLVLSLLLKWSVRRQLIG